jgi:hypothetical protein
VVHFGGTTSTFKNGRQPIGYFMVTKLMEFSKSSGSYGASISII